MKKTILIAENNCDRIDAFIAENTDISRSRAVKLIESGEVTLNGRSVNKKKLGKGRGQGGVNRARCGAA